MSKDIYTMMFSITVFLAENKDKHIYNHEKIKAYPCHETPCGHVKND